MQIKLGVYCTLLLFFLASKSSPAQTTGDIIENDKIISAQDSIDRYIKSSHEAYNRGDLSTFKEHIDMVLDIAKRKGLAEVITRALVNQAIYYQQTDQYDESLSKYLEAEETSKSLADESMDVLIQINIGNLYNAMGDYDKAISTMEKVLFMNNTKLSPDNVLATAYNTMGTAALNKKDFSAALSHFQKVKELSIKMDRVEWVYRAMINISESYIKLGKYEEANKVSNEVLESITPKESLETKALANLMLATSFMRLDKSKEALGPLLIARDIAAEAIFLK